jgi:uncharacterized membrane protein SirB2
MPEETRRLAGQSQCHLSLTILASGMWVASPATTTCFTAKASGPRSKIFLFLMYACIFFLFQISEERRQVQENSSFISFVGLQTFFILLFLTSIVQA